MNFEASPVSENSTNGRPYTYSTYDAVRRAAKAKRARAALQGAQAMLAFWFGPAPALPSAYAGSARRDARSTPKRSSLVPPTPRSAHG